MTFSRKILVLLALASALAVVAPALAATHRHAQSETLLAAVNAARASYGLQPLHADTTLARAARSHSLSMLRGDYFAHGDFRDRMLSFHVRGPVVGENLAWGSGPYGQARTIVEEWLRSPEHRANLLRPGFRRIGIGTTRGTFLGNGGATIVTADFAGS